MKMIFTFLYMIYMKKETHHILYLETILGCIEQILTADDDDVVGFGGLVDVYGDLLVGCSCNISDTKVYTFEFKNDVTHLMDVEVVLGNKRVFYKQIIIPYKRLVMFYLIKIEDLDIRYLFLMIF